MANGQQGITIVINAQTAGAAAELQKFFTNFTGQLNGLSALSEGLNSLLGGLAVGVGISQLAGFVEKSVQATRQLAQLNAALQSAGAAGAANADALARQRAELTALTGASQGQLIAVQKTLLVNGATMEQLKELVPLALDYAAATGQDATSAAEQLGRAIAGQAVQMRGVRLQIDQTLPKYLQYAQLIDQLHRRVGGQAVAAYETDPELIDFERQKATLEKNIGSLLNQNIVGPFLQAFSGALDTATNAVKHFNENYPVLANSLQGLAALAGQLAPLLIPVALALGAIVSVSGAVRLAMMALAPAIALVNAQFMTLTGYALKDFFVTAASGASGFGTAIGLVLPVVLRLSAALTAVYLAYKTVIAASQMWAAQAQESESNINVGRQLDQLNAALLKNIDLLVQARAMTQQQGDALKRSLAQAKTDWASNTISVDQYRQKLHDAGIEVRGLTTAIQQNAEAEQAASFARAQLSKYKDQLILLENAVQYSRAQSLAALEGAQLQAQEAQLKESYSKRIYDLQGYFTQRKQLIDQEIAAERLPLLERQAQLPGEIAMQNVEFGKYGNALTGQLRNDLTDTDRDQALKLQQQINKLKAEEQQINDQLAATDADRVQKMTALAAEQRENLDTLRQDAQAQMDIALQQHQNAIDNIQNNPFLNQAEKQSLIEAEIRDTSAELLKQIQYYEQLIQVRDANGESAVDLHAKILELEQKNTQITQNSVSMRTSLRYSEADAASSILGSMASAARMYGQQGFIAYKALAIAQATVAGALAVVKELAQDSWWGAAAAAAAAAIQIATIVSTGYDRGGYTGDGPAGQVAGVAHRGEYVFSAPSVDRIGVPMLEALHSGNVAPLMAAAGPVGAAAASPSTSMPPRIIISDERKRIRDLKSDPQFNSVIVDIMKDNLWRFRA